MSNASSLLTYLTTEPRQMKDSENPETRAFADFASKIKANIEARNPYMDQLLDALPAIVLSRKIEEFGKKFKGLNKEESLELVQSVGIGNEKKYRNANRLCCFWECSSPPGSELLSCPCRAVRYCGPTCQKLDWKTHKKTCSAKTESKTIEGGKKESTSEGKSDYDQLELD